MRDLQQLFHLVPSLRDQLLEGVKNNMVRRLARMGEQQWSELMVEVRTSCCLHGYLHTQAAAMF